MDPNSTDVSEARIIVLTPPQPWPQDIKIEMYGLDTFMALFRYGCPIVRCEDSNSKGIQFSANEKLSSSICQNNETQTLNPTEEQSTQTLQNKPSLQHRTSQTEKCNAEESMREFHDQSSQVNMLQTGIVRPVVRGSEAGKPPDKSQHEDSKQSMNQEADQGNQSMDKTNEKLDLFKQTLNKLQILARNVARDNPSGKFTLLSQYLDVISDLSQMLATNKIEKLQSFLRQAEENLSSHRYWSLITEKSDRKTHLGKDDTDKIDQKRTEQIPSLLTIPTRPSFKTKQQTTIPDNRSVENPHSSSSYAPKQSAIQSYLRNFASLNLQNQYPRVDGGLAIERCVSTRSEEHPQYSLHQSPRFKPNMLRQETKMTTHESCINHNVKKLPHQLQSAGLQNHSNNDLLEYFDKFLVNGFGINVGPLTISDQRQTPFESSKSGQSGEMRRNTSHRSSPMHDLPHRKMSIEKERGHWEKTPPPYDSNFGGAGRGRRR